MVILPVQRRAFAAEFGPGPPSGPPGPDKLHRVLPPLVDTAESPLTESYKLKQWYNNGTTMI